jgi:hypothetical protein
MLAKKILNKIETENDPTENVVPKGQIAATVIVVEEPNNESSKDESLPLEQKQTEAAPQCKTCNCKRSKCLKLYCECFANNKFCGANCACNGCSNVATHDDERL